MEDQGKTSHQYEMAFEKLERAIYAENYRKALARKPQPMYDSDDSEDGGLLTPVSSPSEPQNHNQNPQIIQQQQSSPSRERTAPPPSKIRPYACRVTKSMRLDGPNRPTVGTRGAEAVALHPRRKGWVTFRDRGRQISMTFERYLREHVRIAYNHIQSQLNILADSSRHVFSTIP